MLSPKPPIAPEREPLYDPRDLQGRLAAARPVVRPAAAPEPASLLVVDDNDLVRTMFGQMLRSQGYDVTCAGSASEARECLSDGTFDIMLCDICMPGQNGMELLSEVTLRYPDTVVILITGAGTAEMARDAVQGGASDFITKPCNQGELAIIIQRNLTRRALQRKHAQRYRIALETSNESVLDALLTALNTRDTETQGHSERVTAYTMELADHMVIPPGQVYHIERGALLHDIGKIGIPDRILHKPAALDDEEWGEMRKHPVIGYQMCAKIDLLRTASQIVLHHHERWDGGGYPSGLSGESVPLGARIFAVADTLDAMTSDRPYRKGAAFGAAREEIIRGAGTQFDPGVVRIFLTIPEARWSYIRAHAAR